MPTARASPLTEAARRFAAELAARSSLPVDLVDERWSSQDAEERLRDATRQRRAQAARDARRRGCGGGRSNSGTLVRKTRNMTQQTRPNGTLRHLLTLEGMPRQQIEALLTRAQKFVKPDRRAAGAEAHARRHHRGEHVHRAVDAHARVVRARGQAARRRRGQSRSAALFAREGREHARHHLHARSLPRGRVRHPRCRGRCARASSPRTCSRMRACCRPAKRTSRIPPRGCSTR